MGTALTVGGIVGFFFDVDDSINALHLGTGLLGLLALGYGARTYAVAIGVVYVVIGIWGVLPAGAGGRVAHLAIGVLGLFAGTR